MTTPPTYPRCDWCSESPAVELVVRIRPSGQGGQDRAFSLACTPHAESITQVMAGFEDIIAIYRMRISPLVPASEEAL